MADTKFTIAVHGGAGVIERSRMTPDIERAYRSGLEAALNAGAAVLSAGGTSLDAVVAAVTVLEDDPLFNAGRGAVFTAEGRNELDAAVMEGATLRAGAVTLLTTVRNPVQLARVVMEKTPHVLLGGAGAEVLARENGLAIVEPSYFFTDRRWQALQRVKQAAGTASEAEKHGTVGAVALDRHGDLAAATSTGGRNNKLPGRISDSALIGAGTYANNATAAISCTGDGDYFIRAAAAHALSSLMALSGWSVERAAEHAIRAVAELGGSGGLIALDRHGNLAMPFDTPGMYRGYVTSDGARSISMFRD
jgi:L-asparaginase / beta-aspartyl-peptidase